MTNLKQRLERRLDNMTHPLTMAALMAKPEVIPASELSEADKERFADYCNEDNYDKT